MFHHTVIHIRIVTKLKKEHSLQSKFKKEHLLRFKFKNLIPFTLCVKFVHFSMFHESSSHSWIILKD